MITINREEDHKGIGLKSCVILYNFPNAYLPSPKYDRVTIFNHNNAPISKRINKQLNLAMKFRIRNELK